MIVKSWIPSILRLFCSCEKKYIYIYTKRRKCINVSQDIGRAGKGKEVNKGSFLFGREVIAKLIKRMFGAG